MKSQFDKWFEALFGPRNIEFKEMTDTCLRNYCENARAELGYSECELEHRARWDAQKEAARYTKAEAPEFEIL